jgi:Flp pilus assembly protein TadB
MKESNESEWISTLMEDLQSIEEIHEPEIPEQYQLMNTLNELKAKRKAAFKRELAVFLITALMILTLYATIAFKMTTIFIWIQVLALIFIPIIFIAEAKRRRKQERVTMF